MKNVCLSGGAKGADVAWGNAAKEAGHTVIHLGFQGMNQSHEPFKVLNVVKLLEADEHLKKANQTLKRGSFPYKSEYVNNLLRRNFWQIKHTERVYGVGWLKDGMVQGGTGWAFQMAFDRGIFEQYFFDQITNKWWKLVHLLFGFKWVEADKPPKPHGVYTGIGTRELSNDGRLAIRTIYLE